VRRVAALRYGSAYYSPERDANLVEQVRALAAAGRIRDRYDLVWACQSLMAGCALAVDAGTRVLDIDNVAAGEKLRSSKDRSVSFPIRLFRKISAVVLAREERRRCAGFQHVVLPSDLEQTRLGRVDTEVSVIPNTVHEGERIDNGKTTPAMLLTGTLDYEPNVDALRWLTAEILPGIQRAHPGVELTVAGRNPTAEVLEICAAAGAMLIPNAPSLEPLFAAARVVVAPLRLGGGTRIKILEAMARGAAIVATPIGAEGLLVRDGYDLYLAEDPETFAARCLALLRDPSLAARLGAAAHTTWSDHYRPEIAKARIVSLVERLSPITSREASTRAAP
jgi:glycosyltransferase involved in cell wall biosynthesis